MNIFKSTICCLLLIIAIFYSAGVFAEENQEEFRIGVIASLSGPWANFGNGAKNGALFAHQNLPVDLRKKTKLFFEDDQLSPTKTVSALKKLQSIDNIDALITWSSGTSKAVAPIAEANKIPMIAIASDPGVSRGKKFVFNMWVTPQEQSKLLFPRMLELGYKKIARIITTHDGAISCKEAFDAINEGEIEIVLDTEYSHSDSDFRSYIAKLKTKDDIDAIIAILLPGQIGNFAKQVKEAQLKIPLVGYETMADKDEVRISQGGLEGAWFATAENATEGFVADFEKEFPDSALYTVSNVYDAVTLLTKSHFDKKQTIAEFLFGLKDYDGTSGSTLR